MIDSSHFALSMILPTAIAVIAISVYTDCRWRIIKNSITFPAIALGLLLHTLGNGWSGLGFAIFGLLVGFGLMAIPFLFGQMGAGDLKLMAALGALFGAYEILNIFLYTTIAGGILALGFAAYHKDIIHTFKKIWLMGKCIFLLNSPGAGSELFKKSIPMPYGLAIGIGTVVFLTLGKIV